MAQTNVHIHPPFIAILNAYFIGLMVVLFGYLRDLIRSFFPDQRILRIREEKKKGFAPLLKDKDDFYSRRVYGRGADCWTRPICSRPGGRFDVMGRDFDSHWKLTLNGKVHKNVINLCSYNYLGFSQNPEYVNEGVFASLDRYGINTCSTMSEFGYTAVHKELEQRIANFLKKEDAILFGMGYATNSTVIPAFASKGTLLISDSLNHASIVTGARASGATIKVFRHNDTKHLEHVIRQAIVDGQPKTHREWKKIIIIVEGLYSMEGEVPPLAEIIRIKKLYKCYLYVDEAHSFGALGATGHGITEELGVDTADIDIMMGTFTKSFGSVGGYICSSKELVDHLRYSAFGPLYASCLPAGCAQQVISAMKVITGEDGSNIGKERLAQLKDNITYFRNGLKKLGFDVIGDPCSPVVILMVYLPAALPCFSRLCLERGLAVVLVGPPACDLEVSRVRFCISAAHTKQDLDDALRILDEVGDNTCVKFKKSSILQTLLKWN